LAEVRVDQISKRFGPVTAVDDVSWAFQDGKLTVLVGPSGCGKTTLLRLIAGLEEVSAGQVFIADQPVNHLPPWERNTAMVFQSYALYPHKTVYDNMAFPLQARKLSKEDIRQQVTQTARALDIHGLLERKPRELSGGQMQRVALGRAIVRQPHVFLMDEPLSNLDAKLRVDMRGELKRLQKELGVTTIYVTHDQAEAMTMADTLLVMREGRIEQAGEPDTLYQNPRTVFVAGFIGSPSMNFLSCQYDHQSHQLVTAGAVVPLPAPAVEHLQRQKPSSPLLLGIRPEDLVVGLDVQSHALPARVYIAEPMGRETLLTLEAGFLPEGQHWRAITSPQLRPAIGQTVWLRLLPAAIHLFDEANGEALAMPFEPGKQSE
jgi:multiple sugar transport system ATP-binding protein